MGSLAGKVAVITGASRGIGAACARAFAAEGMRLALLARTAGQLEALAAECAGVGADALALPCDVTRAASVNEAVDLAVARFGKIDLLVNSAGVGTYKRLMELSEDEWDEMVSVNLTGTFRMLKAVIPQMTAARSGHVISISSTRGFETLPETVGYSATKFGLMGMHSALAQDMQQYRIQVTLICPGGVRTEFRGIPVAEKDPNWLSAEQVAEAVVYAAKVPYPATVTQINLVPLT